MVKNTDLFKFLPSRKLAVSFLILFAGAGFFYLYKNEYFSNGSSRQAKIAAQKTEQFISSFLTDEQANLDGDNDGLRNWEETLWGTDANNKDTDRDGFPDGEEVFAGYDPVLFDSNISTGKKREQVFFAADANPENVNFTKELAKSVSASIVQNPDLSPQDLSDPEVFINSNSSRQLAEFASSFNITISENDLKIIKDNSARVVQSYSDDVGTILSKDLRFQKDSSVNADFLSQDSEFLDKYLNDLGQFISQLKNLPAPSDFAQMHKRLIELLMVSQKSFEMMKMMKTDPLKAMIAIQQEDKTITEINSVLAQFSKAVQEHKAVFR